MILKPKDFIKAVLIDELGTMIKEHPYISFIIMGIGIEFLGKCIDTKLNDWTESGRSRSDFENSIRSIPSLRKYETYLTTYDLYGSFRCGLAHAIAPKIKITLSSNDQMGHLVETDGRLNLKAEDFYTDFKSACEHVISITYPTGDKMNGDYLEVPGTSFNPVTSSLTGTSINMGSSVVSNSTSSAASGTPSHNEFKL